MGRRFSSTGRISCRGEVWCALAATLVTGAIALVPGAGAAPPTDTSTSDGRRSRAFAPSGPVPGVRRCQRRDAGGQYSGLHRVRGLRRGPDGGGRLRGHAPAVRIQLLRGACARHPRRDLGRFSVHVRARRQHLHDGLFRLGNLLGRRPGGGRHRAAAGWAAGRNLQLRLRGGGLRRVHRRHSLIQRGTCDFSVKIANAVAAGGRGIIFNEGNTEERLGIEFGQAAVPAGRARARDECRGRSGAGRVHSQ